LVERFKPSLVIVGNRGVILAAKLKGGNFFWCLHSCDYDIMAIHLTKVE
jgi:hypothetical protein